MLLSSLAGFQDSSIHLILTLALFLSFSLSLPPPPFSSSLRCRSPDLAAAQKVADFIGTEHYGFRFTVQEGIDAVSDVIYHLETYDITTIRAGTPMFLLSRKVKAMGIKMVMSGEGADETLAGYLYFHKAPNGTELHEECVRKVCWEVFEGIYAYRRIDGKMDFPYLVRP